MGRSLLARAVPRRRPCCCRWRKRIGPSGPPAATNRAAHRPGCIIAAFLLGLFYLTQTVGTAMTARRHRVALPPQRADIEQSDPARSRATSHAGGAEPAIVHGAQQAGMDSLGTSLRVPGR